MELLSEHPVSGEYLSRLQQDLEMAESVRFAVGYVTKRGLQAIGVERLARVLQHPDSFGVSSLTCEIGFSPLYALQAHAQVGDRLRYLMGAQDMRVLREELSGPALMHSKLVRIVRRDGIVVVYLGSHNWSGRALGTQDLPRNAEISMRLVPGASPVEVTKTPVAPLGYSK